MGSSFFTIWAVTLQAEEAEKSDSKIPIVSIGGNYQIFPEKSLGNGVYRKGDFLISDPELAIFDIYNCPGGYIYAGKDSAGKTVLRYNGEKNAKFSRLHSRYYQLILKSGISKLYRVYRGKIQDLLPKSITANGMAVNRNGRGAFFHISKGETIIDDNGVNRYQYTFKIHIVEPGSNRVINVQTPISDFIPELRISWASSSVLEYTLSNGNKRRVKYKTLTGN